MRNHYAGICYRCGETVPAGDGHFERVGRRHRDKWPGKLLPRWLLQHAPCAIKWRGSVRHYEHAPDAPEAEEYEK